MIFSSGFAPGSADADVAVASPETDWAAACRPAGFGISIPASGCGLFSGPSFEIRGSAAKGLIVWTAVLLRTSFGFSSIRETASWGGCFSGAAWDAAGFSGAGAEAFPVIRWMPTPFFVTAACAGDCSDGLGSVAVDLACLPRLEAVFVEDSSSPVFADLAMPLRVAERGTTVAWSASVGVLERVFRVGIQLDLVRWDPAALTSGLVGFRHLSLPGFCCRLCWGLNSVDTRSVCNFDCAALISGIAAG